MNKNKLLIVIGVISIIALLFIYWVYQPKSQPPTQTQDENQNQGIPQDILDHINSKKDLIVVDQPAPLTKISSPLTVKGKARGTWFFEATFPIVLVDWDGKIIAESHATATSDWMTEDFVPFEAIFEFQIPETAIGKKGTLIFKKDNPSGLPEHDDALEIPITF